MERGKGRVMSPNLGEAKGPGHVFVDRGEVRVTLRWGFRAL